MATQTNTAQRIETGIPQVSAEELAQMEKTLALLKQARAPDAAGDVTGAVTPRRRRAQTKEPTMNAIPTASGTTTSKSNQPTLDSVLEKVKEIAETQGKAADGLTKLLLTTAEAAFAGAIDRQKDKHGPGVKDNSKIAELYVKVRTGATTFDTKPVKARKFLSIIDTMIRLGMWPKGGTKEPLSTLNSFVTLHQKMRKDPTQVGSLIDLPNAMLKYAREQVKRDSIMSEHEYRSFLVKVVKDPRSEEDFLDAERKRWLRAKSGKGGFTVDADTADKAINACSKRLKEIAKAKAPQPADHVSAAAEVAA